MNSEVEKDFLDKPAKIISVIFHPLFIPVYGMIVIFSSSTLFGYLPLDRKSVV